MGKYKPSESAKEFFDLFRETREEIADENVYHLSEAIMLSFDKWHKWEYANMPESDGDYYCYIRRNNEYGAVSHYYQVCQCVMNNWVLKDKESVLGWHNLLES